MKQELTPMQHPEPREYTIVDVQPAEPGAEGADGEAAPREILERFEGRTFTLNELEQRGVRIAGGRAVYTVNGRDWLLEIFPDIGER